MSFFIYGNKKVKPRRALRSPAYILVHKFGPLLAGVVSLAILGLGLLVGDTQVTEASTATVAVPAVSTSVVSEEPHKQTTASSSSSASESRSAIPNVAKSTKEVKKEVEKKEPQKIETFTAQPQAVIRAPEAKRSSKSPEPTRTQERSSSPTASASQERSSSPRATKSRSSSSPSATRTRKASPKPSPSATKKTVKKATVKKAVVRTVSTARCSGKGSVRGMTSRTIKVRGVLCARFPGVYYFGGYRAGSGGFHGSGRAIDAMIKSNSYGWTVAKYARANAKSLGISEVIFAQKIWTRQRSSEGWRSMSDRGSRTANHYDHVHVSVY